MATSNSPTTPSYRRARRYARQGTRSKAELVAYLTRLGIDPSDQRTALRRLRAEGWVDDRACAALLAEAWARRGYAAAAIRERLRRKGLALDMIERAVGAGSVSQERTRAREAAEGQARRLASRGVNGPRAAARVARWLAARGFEESIVDEVVHEVVGISSEE